MEPQPSQRPSWTVVNKSVVPSRMLQSVYWSIVFIVTVTALVMNATDGVQGDLNSVVNLTGSLSLVLSTCMTLFYIIPPQLLLKRVTNMTKRKGIRRENVTIAMMGLYLLFIILWTASTSLSLSPLYYSKGW
jgi:hypothetical protein